MIRAFAIVVLLSAALFPSFIQKDLTGTLKLEITDLHSSKGHIGITLFNGKGGFPMDHNKAYKKLYLPITNNHVEVSLKDLPLGEYAVVALHDENSNEKMDSNFLGIPKEGFAISNNIKVKFSMPAFDEAKFKLNSSEQSIILKMQYMDLF